jgi:hypothetical protein
MKAFSIALVGLATLGSVVTSQAQTADEIIAKHITAIGGKEKLAQINSIHQESTIEVMGNEASSTTIIVNGKGFKNEVNFGGQKIVQCVTDKGGWSINPMMGQTTAEPMTEEQLTYGKEQLDIGGPLLNYQAKGNKVEFAGKEDVNGVSALKIKVTTKANVQSTYFIDPTTYYVIRNVSKASMNGQEMETTINFSDYKKTDFGYVIPYSTELNLPQGFTIKSTTKKVEINKPVDESVFKAS